MYMPNMNNTFNLAPLRRSRECSQVEVAAAMGLSQPAVSRLESRADISLAALRDYLRAIGGELEVAVRFGGERVELPTAGLEYGERATGRRVREQAPKYASSVRTVAEEPVVAPEWLDEVDRIRAMTPTARMREVANVSAVFAKARRLD